MLLYYTEAQYAITVQIYKEINMQHNELHHQTKNLALRTNSCRTEERKRASSLFKAKRYI